MRPIVDNLTPPVDLDRDHWRIGERATVTLVEYADDGCPYSRMTVRAIQRLEAATRRPATIRYPAPSPHPHPPRTHGRRGLNRRRLEVDLASRTVWLRVQADADSALASGAGGTPTLLINGRLHVAGYDEPTLGAALATAIKER
jgi:hypothetical protein